MKREIILASQSPRRRELLQLCVPDFTVQAAHIDERRIEKSVMGKKGTESFLDRAKCLVETLAKEKATVILSQHPTALVIGADTVVVHQEKVLGKPRDEQQAYEMIRSYAGKVHSVVTGVSVQTADKKETFAIETKVRFFDWNEQMAGEVNEYIASGSPMDKAGAYGIQELPGLWVAGIEGDYPNVVGFPVAYVNRMLQTFE